jgi:hypothetical protein
LLCVISPVLPVCTHCRHFRWPVQCTLAMLFEICCCDFSHTTYENRLDRLNLAPATLTSSRGTTPQTDEENKKIITECFTFSKPISHLYIFICFIYIYVFIYLLFAGLSFRLGLARDLITIIAGTRPLEDIYCILFAVLYD